MHNGPAVSDEVSEPYDVCNGWYAMKEYQHHSVLDNRQMYHYGILPPVHLATKVHCILLSYTTCYYVTLHTAKLHYTLLSCTTYY